MASSALKGQRFDLGRIHAQPRLMETLIAVAANEGYARWQLAETMGLHARGEWGPLTSDEDAALNEWLLARGLLLSNGHLIISVQNICDVAVEVVTNAAEQTTTVRLADRCYTHRTHAAASWLTRG